MQFGLRISILLLICNYHIIKALVVTKFNKAFITSQSRIIKKTSLQGVGSGIDLAITPSTVDLSTIGNEIEVLPPMDGIKKIVMKFGGSSLANAERVTYVAKLIKKHVDQGITYKFIKNSIFSFLYIT